MWGQNVHLEGSSHVLQGWFLALFTSLEVWSQPFWFCKGKDYPKRLTSHFEGSWKTPDQPDQMLPECNSDLACISVSVLIRLTVQYIHFNQKNMTCGTLHYKHGWFIQTIIAADTTSHRISTNIYFTVHSKNWDVKLTIPCVYYCGDTNILLLSPLPYRWWN